MIHLCSKSPLSVAWYLWDEIAGAMLGWPLGLTILIRSVAYVRFLQVGYYKNRYLNLNSDWTWCEGFASTRCFGVERFFLQAAWIMYSSSLRITLSKYSKSIGFEVRGCTFPPKPSPLDGDIRRLKPTPLKITKYTYKSSNTHICSMKWNTIGLLSM